MPLNVKITSDPRTPIKKKPDQMQTFTAQSIAYSSIVTIPSMLSEDERALYFDTARSKYRNKGAVVEIGTWLGSGTFEICRGLEATGKPWSLTVIDRFQWNEFYEIHYAQPGLAAGDSFLPNFIEYLSPYRDKIVPIAGDLADIGALLPLTEDIELLFVDAPKSWRMLYRVLEHLGPRLMPGAQIVFQDFFHITSRQLIWLLMSVPQFQISTIVQTGTTAVFDVSGPVPDLSVHAPKDFRKLTIRDFLALWERMRATLPARRAAELAVGIALDLMDKEALEEASDILAEGVAETPYVADVVKEVRRLLKKADKETQKLLQIREFLTAGRPLGGMVDAA